MPSVRKQCPFCGHMFAMMKVVGYDEPGIYCEQCHAGFKMTEYEADTIRDQAVAKVLGERYDRRPKNEEKQP